MTDNLSDYLAALDAAAEASARYERAQPDGRCDDCQRRSLPHSQCRALHGPAPTVEPDMYKIIGPHHDDCGEPDPDTVPGLGPPCECRHVFFQHAWGCDCHGHRPAQQAQEETCGCVDARARQPSKCGASSGRGRACSLPLDHTGEHVSCDTWNEPHRHRLATWPQEGETCPAEDCMGDGQGIRCHSRAHPDVTLPECKRPTHHAGDCCRHPVDWEPADAPDPEGDYSVPTPREELVETIARQAGQLAEARDAFRPFADTAWEGELTGRVPKREFLIARNVYRKLAGETDA